MSDTDRDELNADSPVSGMLTEQDGNVLEPLNADGPLFVDDRNANEKKTGRVIKEHLGSNLDPLYVMSCLPTPEAVKAYVQYLKDHARRLQQLEALARGELTPSVTKYG